MCTKPSITITTCKFQGMVKSFLHLMCSIGGESEKGQEKTLSVLCSVIIVTSFVDNHMVVERTDC